MSHCCSRLPHKLTSASGRRRLVTLLPLGPIPCKTLSFSRYSMQSIFCASQGCASWHPVIGTHPPPFCMAFNLVQAYQCQHILLGELDQTRGKDHAKVAGYGGGYGHRSTKMLPQNSYPPVERVAAPPLMESKVAFWIEWNNQNC